MDTKNKKINNVSFKRLSQKKGIALIFSIFLSTIFLTIALGTLNIAVKELNFSSSAKDTNNAFYAADSGIECALLNDKTGSTTFTQETEARIFCFGAGEIQINYSVSINSDSQDFNFFITNLGSDGRSCVKVNVFKTLDTTIDPSEVLSTKITARGYNVGDYECSSSDINNRVERVIEVNY
jgi:Tfp pilus assembly protein PilX